MVAPTSQPDTRSVVCAHCEGELQIPVSAMSVNCRHCNQRLIIEDLKIKAYHAVVRLATAGKVEVAKNARVVAEVRVAELIVHGTVQGNVRAFSRVTVGKKGRIEGDVDCYRLKVEPGGKVLGRLNIGQQAAPRPQPVASPDDV